MKKILFGATVLLLLPGVTACCDDDKKSDEPAQPAEVKLVTPNVSARIADPLNQNPFTGILEIYPLLCRDLDLLRQLHQQQKDRIQRLLHHRRRPHLRRVQPAAATAGGHLQHGLLGHSRNTTTPSTTPRPSTSPVSPRMPTSRRSTSDCGPTPTAPTCRSTTWYTP